LIDKAQNNYRPGIQGGCKIIQAVQKKEGYTRNVYLKKAMKLDAKFAPGDTSKPFLRQSNKHSQQATSYHW